MKDFKLLFYEHSRSPLPVSPFYNNTIVNNQMGATDVNNIIALNNLVKGNTL